jgi:hypothetical protein
MYFPDGVGLGVGVGVGVGCGVGVAPPRALLMSATILFHLFLIYGPGQAVELK